MQIDWYDELIDASTGAVLDETYLGSTCSGGGGAGVAVVEAEEESTVRRRKG